MFFHFFGEQLGVFRRVPDHERRAEAGGEGRFRLGYADFGTGDFRGVAADEVVHRLRRTEFGDRRQDAESVAGEEDDIGRLAGLARDARVADVFNRVAGAGVAG